MLSVAVGCLWTIFIFCFCISTYCSYIIWVLGNTLFICWRIAWLVVGSILFWRHIYPNNLCGDALNHYMWANLIIGYVQIVIAILFLLIYRPTPLVIAPIPVVPTFTQPVMMTSQRLASFGGPGVTIGGTNTSYYRWYIISH